MSEGGKSPLRAPEIELTYRHKQDTVGPSQAGVMILTAPLCRLQQDPLGGSKLGRLNCAPLGRDGSLVVRLDRVMDVLQASRRQGARGTQRCRLNGRDKRRKLRHQLL